MKDKIEQIVGKVESGHLEPKEAVDELLALSGVSQQRELLLDFVNVLNINELLEPNVERITIDDINEYLKI